MPDKFDRLLAAWNIATQRHLAANELCQRLRGADKGARAIAMAYAAELSAACDNAEHAYYSAVRSEGKVANG